MKTSYNRHLIFFQHPEGEYEGIFLKDFFKRLYLLGQFISFIEFQLMFKSKV